MSDPQQTYEGGCTCRAVRYRMISRPLFVHCCHCRWCQRETGASFALNAMIEADRVEIVSGAPEVVVTPSNSGKGQKITRCPTCRIALWSDYGRRPPIRFVRVGTLVEPHATKPDAHIFTRSKVPWVRLPDDAPQFEIFYELDKQWSAESLARRKAILG